MESRYWKDPLIRTAKLLENAKARSLGKHGTSRLEREIVIGFYSVRRLIESIVKLTDETRASLLSVTVFLNIGEVTYTNSHRLDELYRMSTPVHEIRDAIFVCGRIAHNSILEFVNDENGFCGFMFTSDRDEQSKLYYLDFDQVIRLFRTVGSDYPSTFVWERGVSRKLDTFRLTSSLDDPLP